MVTAFSRTKPLNPALRRSRRKRFVGNMTAPYQARLSLRASHNTASTEAQRICRRGLY
jgi:hypothetical protein